MEGTVRRMPDGRRPFKPRTALLRLEADRGFGSISDTVGVETCLRTGARLLPVLDCKKMYSSSRKMRQRNPSHLGSYIHSLPMGKLFTARAFIGVIGGLVNRLRIGSARLALEVRDSPAD